MSTEDIDIDHDITVDQVDIHAEGPQFKAYCVCGWAGDWHHADEFGPVPTTDADAFEAHRSATDEGQGHLADWAVGS